MIDHLIFIKVFDHTCIGRAFLLASHFFTPKVFLFSYGTALVQRHEYTRVTRMVAACGSHMYSHSRLTCEYI